MSLVHSIIDNESVYQSDKARASTILAFDFGERRLGVATGTQLILKANPLTTIDNESNKVRFNLISALVDEWQPSLFVVGLPLNLQGEETEISQLARKFARRLNGRFNLPVILVDERFSSAEASEQLKAQGVHGIDQKQTLDQVAAQTILQSYFDQIA